MSKSTVIENFEKECKLDTMPDIFFGDNKVVIQTPAYDLEFSAQESAKFFKLSFVKSLKNKENDLERINFVFDNDIKVKT